MKRPARHIALLQRQQYRGSAATAAARSPLCLSRNTFSVLHSTLSFPFSCSVGARSNGAFRSARRVLSGARCPFAVCRILRAVAIEFSYVHAIYNVARARNRRDSSSSVGDARADFEAVETRVTARCRLSDYHGRLSFFGSRRRARGIRARHHCVRAFALLSGTSFSLGHLSIDNPYYRSPLHGFTLTQIILSVIHPFLVFHLFMRERSHAAPGSPPILYFREQIPFDNVSFPILAHVAHHLAALILFQRRPPRARILSHVGFLITSLSPSSTSGPSSSSVFCSFSLPFHERTHFPRVDPSSSFSLVPRSFSVHTHSHTNTLYCPTLSRSLSFCFPVFQSLFVSFFILLDATFALVHRRPVTFPFFFFFFISFFVSPPHRLVLPAMRDGIFGLFYSRRPLHFSFSFDAYAVLCPFRVVRAVASFIVFVPRCPPYCLVAAAANLPPLRYLSRFSTHVNARSLIFLGSLFLAFVLPLCARARDPPPPPALRDIFRFPCRYVRSVSDT